MIELTKLGQLIQTLKKTRVKAQKIDLLRAYLRGSSCAATVWTWLLDPLITFGITKIPPTGFYHHEAVPDPCDATFPGLCRLMANLQTRSLTGNAAAYCVRRLYDHLTTAEAKLAFQAIIERRPDCGVNASTANKAQPGLISAFQAMLAQPWNEAKVQKMIDTCGHVLVEPKYDGERRIAICTHKDHVNIYSRQGRLDSHVPEMNQLLGKFMSPGLVIDGELYPLDKDFARMAGIMRSKSEFTLKEANLVFVVFDVLNITEWNTKQSQLNQLQRTAWAHTTVRNFVAASGWGGWVESAPSTSCKTVSEVDDLYLQALDKGLEGVIIKRPDAKYAFKRSNDWIKRKMEETVDLAVTGFLPGDPGKQFENSLGRMVCFHKDKEIHVSPGKMSHEERQHVWDNDGQYLGCIIEVAFQEETPDGSLRHPRFHRWRSDKD